MSLDENILAASLYSKQFHVIESATTPTFNTRFAISAALQAAAPAYTATIYAMFRMFEEPFGSVEKIVVDYDGGAKLVLLVLKDGLGYVGLVLNTAANVDYLALKLKPILEDKDNEKIHFA